MCEITSISWEKLKNFTTKIKLDRVFTIPTNHTALHNSLKNKVPKKK